MVMIMTMTMLVVVMVVMMIFMIVLMGHGKPPGNNGFCHNNVSIRYGSSSCTIQIYITAEKQWQVLLNFQEATYRDSEP